MVVGVNSVEKKRCLSMKNRQIGFPMLIILREETTAIAISFPANVEKDGQNYIKYIKEN